MKAIDLLKYLDKADPKYIEEASDYNLLLYRKGRKRTRTALAACLILVVLAGVFLTKPALYAWETRNTVTSWNDSLLGVSSKPSSSVMISAEMPDQKRFAADTPFTLSVGMGQVSDYEYATISVKAYGFEITDKDGNTVTDRYVRTFSNFNSGDYGMVYRNGKPTSPVTGCQYFEDFTLHFVGDENTTGWGVIEFTLQSRTENGSMGDTVTVWYTLQNGVLKLSDKNPVKGDQNGNGTMLQPEELEPGTVPLFKEDISIQILGRMPRTSLYPGQYMGDDFKIRAFHIPTQKDYPSDGFTAELVYAETLREEDFSFVIKKPVELDPNGDFVVALSPRVPHDAPIGSYDLRITDPETGFVWVFENMAVVLPNNNPAYEDFVFESDPLGYPLAQGDYWPSGGWEPLSLTLHGEDMTPLCRIELEYRTESDGEAYSILLEESCFASYVPPAFVSEDAPAGWYDLVVTYAEYGYSWRCENYVEIIENPDAERYGLYHSMGEHLRVSLSANEVYTFVAKVENRGDPVTVTVTPQDPVAPEAWLTIAYPPADSGELFEIPLDLASTPYFEPYEWTWQTGKTVSQIFEIMVTPDTPCGLYNLTLTYEDCTVTFKDVVEVVP